MVLVFIIILMVPCTKATGVTISNTEKEKNHGPTVQFTKANIWQVKNMEWDFTAGTMEVNILVNGLRIKSKALVLIAG